MNNDLEYYIDKIKTRYNKYPDDTLKKLSVFTSEFDNKSSFIKDNLNTIYKVAFVIIVALLGSVTVLTNEEFSMLYYFGCIFFIAGLYVGLSVPKFGLIFLFSHGGTGIGLMLVPYIMNILKSPYLSDLPNNNIFKLLFCSLLCFIIAFIMTVIYNLSDKFKNNKFSLLITFILYIIGISIILLIPIIYKISIRAI